MQLHKIDILELELEHQISPCDYCNDEAEFEIYVGEHYFQLSASCIYDFFRYTVVPLVHENGQLRINWSLKSVGGVLVQHLTREIFGE